MSESSEKKVQISTIVIALLAIVVAFQTAALISHGHRQAVLEKKLNQAVAPQDRYPLASAYRSAAPVRAYARPTQAPVSPLYSMMNEDPWAEFDQMTQRMTNLMRHAFTFGSPLFQNLSQQGAGFDFTPAVDLKETPEAYVVTSDLPGLDKDKINLTVKDNVLTIEGMRETANETQDDKNGYYAQERSYGSFARSLSLPGPVDESRIAASYQNGVLTITLPKLPGQKSVQKVAIQ